VCGCRFFGSHRGERGGEGGRRTEERREEDGGEEVCKWGWVYVCVSVLYVFVASLLRLTAALSACAHAKTDTGEERRDGGNKGRRDSGQEVREGGGD
jgi:hypothetical protein